MWTWISAGSASASLSFETKRRLVSPFSPSLGPICADRTRGSSHLVCQRVPLLTWKTLGQFEDTNHQRHSSLIGIQFPKMPGGAHNNISEGIYNHSNLTRRAFVSFPRRA